MSLADSLDFGEDNVHICAGDVLAVNDLTVFAQFGPVLSIELIPSRFCVSMNGKLLKSLEEMVHVCTLRHDGKISATSRTDSRWNWISFLRLLKDVQTHFTSLSLSSDWQLISTLGLLTLSVYCPCLFFRYLYSLWSGKLSRSADSCSSDSGGFFWH